LRTQHFPAAATSVRLYTVNPAAPIAFLVVVLVSDAWVYSDATAHSKRGEPVAASLGPLELTTPGAWLVACLLLWIVFVPLYVASRNP
jgi:hypothetical protein